MEKTDEIAIRVAETDESDVLSQGSQNQNDSAGQLHQSKLDLYNAAVNGDWKKAVSLLMADPRLAETDITEGGETVLHVATGARQFDFVMLLIPFSPKLLRVQDRNGNTPFFIAAAAGCKEIAKIMLEWNPNLLEIGGAQDSTPLNMAVLLGRREMALFLYGRDTSYLTPSDLRSLFFDSITNDLYDFALMLLERKPDLALARHHDNDVSALHVLARKPTSIFKQKARLSPALQLLNRIWYVVKSHPRIIRILITKPSNLLFDATRSGNSSFLFELIRSYANLVYELDKAIFHVAIWHRQFSVFNLINEIGFNKEIIATYVDDKGNSMLHLAALMFDRSPESALSSAALEMQQELIIFQEVEKLMQPALKEAKNAYGLTAHKLLDRQHAELRQRGADWMNNTANSCSLVATLITTVAFAAVFTVPGGTDGTTGTPLLVKKTLFRVFAISNAMALSFSSFSILMFLSILTSGYTQSQFLRSLPLKLMFGLVALFMSIISMMITFSSTYFLLYHDRSYTMPALAAVVVTLPIILFVVLHYPLVRDIFLLTRRSEILSRSGFLPKSDNKMLETQSCLRALVRRGYFSLLSLLLNCISKII